MDSADDSDDPCQNLIKVTEQALTDDNVARMFLVVQTKNIDLAVSAAVWR